MHGTLVSLYLPAYFGRRHWTLDATQIVVTDLTRLPASVVADEGDGTGQDPWAGEPPVLYRHPVAVPYLVATPYWSTGPGWMRGGDWKWPPTVALLFPAPQRVPPLHLPRVAIGLVLALLGVSLLVRRPGAPILLPLLVWLTRVFALMLLGGPFFDAPLGFWSTRSGPGVRLDGVLLRAVNPAAAVERLLAADQAHVASMPDTTWPGHRAPARLIPGPQWSTRRSWPYPPTAPDGHAAAARNPTARPAGSR